jgi:4-hydroxybenzoate polyprenyltransferase
MNEAGRVRPADSAALRPLVIDLDGTLLRSDLLVESSLQFLRGDPQHFWEPFFWLTKGKAVLKRRLAESVDFDVSLLPYSREIIQLADSARAAGRFVVLATASDRLIAEKIARHLGIFDEVMASDGETNLSAGRKRDALVERFGDGGFDYVGNSHDDIPILANACKGYLVDPEPGVATRAMALGADIEVLRSPRTGISPWIKALRLHQWLKNLLIFVPLLAAHRMTDLELLSQGVLAFLFFGLCASSVYLLNDLLDLPDDRQHPVKRMRAFASGRLSVKVGLLLVPLLLISAFGGSLLLLPWQFSATLAVYYTLTLAYSIDLKRRMMVDVMVLASLYTIRIIAGGAVFGLPLTFWILALSMFMFTSLALVKRYAELRSAKVRGHSGKTPGRGYFPADLEMLSALGAASGYLAVMVLALYIQDDATTIFYTHAEIIWFAVPLLLFWISRIWMLTHRGEMNEDPVLFAVRDRISLAIGALMAFTFWLAA